GYPHHFFNPTIEGLKRLFPASNTIQRVFIPVLGHPINGVRSVLDLYACGLPMETKENFLRMTVAELLSRSLEEAVRKDFSVRLCEEGRRRLAANFAIQLRKEK